MRNTCEDCEERRPACHDRCERYKAAVTEHIAKKIWLNNFRPNLTEAHAERIRKRPRKR